MNDKTVLLEVHNLKKYFYGSKKIFEREEKRSVVKAVDDVSFDIYKGETFGIVGESGCGKSTLGRAVIHLMEPTDGQVFYQGIDLKSLSKEEMRLKRQEIQIIFQDPYASLNPRMTVKDLIKAPLDIFSTESEDQKMARMVQLMNLVGLDEACMNKYPHEFSGGQRQRIGIARALIMEPSFVFCDEPVSALDVSVRAQVLNLMKNIQKKLGLTLMFISHDLSVVRFLCDRVAVMYLGKIVEMATKEELYENPKHPYTQALLSSILVPDVDVDTERIILKGDVPSPHNPPSGCHFHTRCAHVTTRCLQEAPNMIATGENSYVACHLYERDQTEEVT